MTMNISEIIAALIEGAEADIWYDPQDADNEQDAAAIAAIDRAQTAMVTAANILSAPVVVYTLRTEYKGDVDLQVFATKGEQDAALRDWCVDSWDTDEPTDRMDGFAMLDAMRDAGEGDDMYLPEVGAIDLVSRTVTTLT